MNRGIDVWRCEGMKKWMDGWLSQWEGVVSVGGEGWYVCTGMCVGIGTQSSAHAQRSEEDIWLPVV